MISSALAVVLLLGGSFFLLVSSVGILRLPDFFTRAHAVGKSDTLGSLLVLAGLAVHNGADLGSAKLLLIVALIAVTNPAGIHTLSRAAVRVGHGVWAEGPSPASPTPEGGRAPTGADDPSMGSRP
jgi:multicomponent Na+:H+ antiporter subunit G